MKPALMHFWCMTFFGERHDEDNTVCSGSQRNPCSHCFLNVCLLHHFFCPPCCLETRMNCLRVFSPLMLKVLFVDPLTQSFHTFIRREDNDLQGAKKKKVTAALNESKPTMSRCLESMSSKSLESTSRCTFKTYLNKYIDHDYLWMEFLGIPLASINSASAFHFTRSSLELSICWPSLTRSASRKSTVKIFWCKPQYVVLKTLKTYSLLLDQQKYIHWAPCYIGEAIYKQKKI